MHKPGASSFGHFQRFANCRQTLVSLFVCQLYRRQKREKVRNVRLILGPVIVNGSSKLGDETNLVELFCLDPAVQHVSEC